MTPDAESPGIGSPGIDLEAPGPVRWICRTLEEAGFETWAVGGAVRDALAGHPSEDWDLTTRAHPKQVRRLFRRTVPIGIEHGTVGVLARDGTLYEVTTFRRDVETTGRHAVVAFADRLDDDLGRRDFTINAVAWHPLRRSVHDPFGGSADMRDRVLRTVGRPEERFAEDYLRILRALRFAGRFGLRVDPETWEALCEAVPRMGTLSPERVREELDKVLAAGAGSLPSAALSLLAASGVLGFLHPELDTPEARARWAAALRTVDGLPGHRLELRLAALLSATGSTEGAVQVLVRLRSSNRRISEIGALAGALASLPEDDTFLVDPVARRRWMVALGRALVLPALRLLAAWYRAMPAPDAARAGADLLRAIRGDLHARVPLAAGELALSGRDLIQAGYRPGPAFGQVFDRLLQEVLADPARNDRPRLLERASELLGEAPDPSEEADHV
jgi:tRNA nucleotidyltransferase (CCA-adding enzyme)